MSKKNTIPSSTDFQRSRRYRPGTSAPAERVDAKLDEHGSAVPTDEDNDALVQKREPAVGDQARNNDDSVEKYSEENGEQLEGRDNTDDHRGLSSQQKSPVTSDVISAHHIPSNGRHSRPTSATSNTEKPPKAKPRGSSSKKVRPVSEEERSSPTHGYGSAAMQGAAVYEASKKQSKPSKQSKEKDVKVTRPRTEIATKQKSISHASRPTSNSHPREQKASVAVEQPSLRPSLDHKQKVSNSARPEAESASDGEKSLVSKIAKDNELKLEKKGRCYPMTGIDNLALLMENDGYSTACFSIYMFRTELDDDTVYQFFERLADAYPKYRYVVEFDPALATAKEKERKKDERDAAQGKAPRTSKLKREAQFDRGRRTTYTKGLKAGGYFRPARWRFDEAFNTKDNIEIVEQCPGDGNEDDLFELAGNFLARHFNYKKPIWEALVVRGLKTSQGARSALMIKIHHCFSDGQGMIMSYHSALGAMQTGKSVKEVQQKFDAATGSEQKKPGQRGVKPTLWGTTRHGFHTLRGLYFRSRKCFTYPASKGTSGSQQALRDGRAGKERASGRFYCHSDGIALKDIKVIREAFSDKSRGMNLTLNDVAVAVLSRALRIAADRTEKNGIVKDKRIAIFVPISVRPRGNWDLANYTTGAIAWFPFHDPKQLSYQQLLEKVHREMNHVKESWLPRIWYQSFDFICKRRAWYLPNYPIGKQIAHRAFRQYHVATNVPGPSQPIKFGQHEAYSYHVLPPSSPGKATMAIGMISYGSDFSLAVSCDAVMEFKQSQLAQEICQAFQDAAAELINAAKTKLAQEK